MFTPAFPTACTELTVSALGDTGCLGFTFTINTLSKTGETNLCGVTCYWIAVGNNHFNHAYLQGNSGASGLDLLDATRGFLTGSTAFFFFKMAKCLDGTLSMN